MIVNKVAFLSFSGITFEKTESNQILLIHDLTYSQSLGLGILNISITPKQDYQPDKSEKSELLLL